MRTILLLIFLFLNLCVTPCFAHKEPTHQYLVKEGYKLLKKMVGSIPNMEAHLGTNEGRTPPNDNSQESTIAAGAWREDTFDPIRKTSSFSEVSTSHFWLSDGKDNDLVYIDVPSPWPTDHTDNAFTKIMEYAHGGWSLLLRKQLSYSFPKTDHYIEYIFVYHNLIDFYKTGTVTFAGTREVTKYFWTFPSTTRTQNPHPETPVNFESTIGYSTEDRRGIAYYILGRMCHLLGDMGVPAHAHNLQHAFPRDLYENSMNVEDSYDVTIFTGNNEDNRGTRNHNWLPLEINSVSALNNGGFIDATNCNTDATRQTIHYLMYTANQLSGHYAAFDIDGDDIVGGTFTSNEFTDATDLITTATASTIPEPGVTSGSDYHNLYFTCPLCTTWDVWPPSSFKIDYRNIPHVQTLRDNAFTYSIRATAGLLYWFAKETGQLESSSCNPELYIQNHNLIANPYTFISQNIHIGNHVDPITPQSGDDGQDAGDVNVVLSAKVLARGSVSVKLEEGFHATTNSNGFFHAIIKDCPSPCPPSLIMPPNPSQNRIVANSTLQQSGIDSIVIDREKETFLLTTVSFEDQLQPKLTIYPNPAKDHLNIEYFTFEKSHTTIQIFDMLGNLIHSIIDQPNLHSGNYSTTFNTVSLSEGSYYIRMQSGMNIVTQQVKIIK